MNKNKLTSLIHKVANRSNLPFNLVLTHFFLDVVLKRLACSEYSKNFVYKGGFLLSSIFGVQERTTIDLDLLLDKMKLDAEVIRQVLLEVFIDKKDGFRFEIFSITPIRDADIYGGFRFDLLCRFENIRVNIPIDFDTGDVITPSPMEYQYHSVFDGQTIPIHAYNPETILAEKLHTIFVRGVTNSRSKDYYDVYLIHKLHKGLNYDLLKTACINTFRYRETIFSVAKIRQTVEAISTDPYCKSRWGSYRKRFAYARDLEFEVVIREIDLLLIKII